MGSKQREHENKLWTVCPPLEMQLTEGLSRLHLYVASLTIKQTCSTVSRQSQTALWNCSQLRPAIRRSMFVGVNRELVSYLKCSILSFDNWWQAKRLNVNTRQLESMGEAHIADAEASKRAAQIFAEMLGLVCHREYFEIGEQMV